MSCEDVWGGSLVVAARGGVLVDGAELVAVVVVTCGSVEIAVVVEVGHTGSGLRVIEGVVADLEEDLETKRS